MAILNIGSWITVSSMVTKHIPNSNNFSYWYYPSWNSTVTHKGAQAWRYYLESNINFIDLESEWYIDTNNNKNELYLYSPYKCTSPNNKTAIRSVRGKIKTFSLNIYDSSYINIENLTLFATGFKRLGITFAYHIQ